MKRRIFTTYADEPIKNIKTPIRKINYATGENEDEANDIVIPNTNNENYDMTVQLLEQIKTLLIVIIALKILCLIAK